MTKRVGAEDVGESEVEGKTVRELWIERMRDREIV